MRVLGLLLLLLGCGAAAHAQQPGGSDVVRTRFGWRPGTVVQVENYHQRVQVIGGNADTTRSALRYRLQVLSHPEGLLIAPTDVESPPVPAGADPRTAFAQDLAARVSRLMPTYLVSGEGELLRVERMEEMKAQLDSLFAPLLAEMGGAPPQMRAMLEGMLSEERLTAGAAEEWNLLVGSWVGAEFAAGEIYAVETEEPAAFLGGMPIPMQHEFSLLEMRACTPAHPEESCAVLQMRSAPDAEAVRKLMAEVLDGVIPGAFAFDELELQNTVTIVLEPHTMLPHRLRVEKWLEGVASGLGTAGQALSQLEERETSFTYPAGP